jgi:hypothetical protein
MTHVKTKFLWSSLVLLAALLLLWLLGAEQIQANALPVLGGALLLIILLNIAFSRFLPREDHRLASSPQEKMSRREKRLYEKMLQEQAAREKQEIDTSLEALSIGSPGLHARAEEVLVKRHSAAVEPLCRIFEHAVKDYLSFSQLPLPEVPSDHLSDPHAEAFLIKVHFDEWDSEVERLKSAINHSAHALARIGDELSLPILEAGTAALGANYRQHLKSLPPPYLEMLCCTGGEELSLLVARMAETVRKSAAG